MKQVHRSFAELCDLFHFIMHLHGNNTKGDITRICTHTQSTGMHENQIRPIYNVVFCAVRNAEEVEQNQGNPFHKKKGKKDFFFR